MSPRTRLNPAETRIRSKRVAVAVAGLLLGSTLLVQSATATPNTSPASLIAITPCRLLDTRAGADNVGPRATPLGANETYVTPGWGAVGQCNIPATATALDMNVTVVNSTASSFLTLFPGDVARPKASNLNWSAGQAATPNSVTSALAATGSLAIYNLAGNVDVIIDVAGYYQQAASGGARAFGHLSTNDTMTNSKNVVSFAHLQAGAHCVEFDPSIDANTAVVTVTMDYGQDLTSTSRMQFTEVLGKCGTNGIEFVTMVYVFGSTVSTFADGGFYFSIS